MPRPELTRVMWANPAARAVWEPRIRAVSQAWQAVEIASVQTGVRAVCLQTASPDGLPGLAARAAAVGLVALPLERQGASGSYGVSQQPLADGQPWEYRVAIAQPYAAEFIAAAWAARSDVEIGTLLGYPACCRDFFARVWGQDGLRDTTWAMGEPVDGPAEANILLRWLGVRLIPHLPCSFACQATIEQGRAYASLLPENERLWALGLLEWPMRWTARHGIAELETPCFKVNMTTDVDPAFRERRRQGVAPAEGASGLRFPYDRPKAAAAAPLRVRQAEDPRPWTDNGFTSRAAMEAGHAMVLGVIDTPGGCVIDLGSGNGELLAQVEARWPGTQVLGVESDPDRAARSKVTVKHGRIEDLVTFRECFDLGLISARRLEEMDGDGSLGAFKAWAFMHIDRLVVYSYDEPRRARLADVGVLFGEGA